MLHRIVSVEDDPGLFNLLKITLRPLPIELHHAKSGQEALQLIPTMQPDLIILDITLPDMRGWDVLDQLSKLPDLEIKGVIVVTGRTETAHRVIARLQEVTAFINKPFKPSELREMVTNVLGLQQA